MVDFALQLVDNFLIQYNVGQALLVALVLSILGALPLKSLKLVGLTLVTFGAVALNPSVPARRRTVSAVAGRG